MTSEPDLEFFALKSLDHGPLTGVSLAFHAIADAFLLLHIGCGCKHKVIAPLSTHDWGRHPNENEAWTEVGDAELIKGSSERIGPYARSWIERVQPNIMGVVSVTFIDLSGEDIVDEVRRVDEHAPCTVRYIKAPGFSGDLWKGWANALEMIVGEVDWSAPTRPREVAILGYLFDRYEGDHAGNLAQLKSLVEAAGLKLGPVLLSGRPFADYLAAGGSEHLIALPWARPAERKIKRLLSKAGRQTHAMDLPMGLAGTAAWLRALCRLAGTPQARADAWLSSREAALQQRLGPLMPQLQGLRAAVFAEAPLAAGLIATLLDLGLRPVLVGLRGHTVGDRTALEATLSRWGHALPDDCEVLEQPSIAAVRQSCGDRISAQQLDVVIGAATEMNALSTLRPATFLGSIAGSAARPVGPRTVEMGFPCREWHTTQPMPFLGHAGVLVLAHRIINAGRLWSSGAPEALVG